MSELSKSLLIIEDDSSVAEVINNIALEQGWETQVAASLSHALEILDQPDFKPQLILVDEHLPDGQGHTLQEYVQDRNPRPLTVILTAFPDLSQAIYLTQQGLFHYLDKPFTEKQLSEVLRRAYDFFSSHHLGMAIEGWIARSQSMQQVALSLQMAARYPSSSVLITGETGSGKDACAQLLHRSTHPEPSNAPFSALNCAAMPAELIEAELFGAARGAYTGSIRDRPGIVDAAMGGTLFLDEIGELPLPMQAKLLRFLETRDYRRIGETRIRRFHGRIVTATLKDLSESVRDGKFREDLFYRLNVLHIHLAPLRERREDILPLFHFFLETLCHEMKRPVPMVRESDLLKIEQLPLPGNARELRNIVERALLLSPLNSRNLVLPKALHAADSETTQTISTFPTFTSSHELTPSTFTGITPHWIQQMPEPEPGASRLEFVECEMIRHALVLHDNHITRASEWLGISRQQLYRRLQKYNIQT